MNRIHQAWRKIEPEQTIHEENGSVPDASPVVAATDSIIFALAADAAASPSNGDCETSLAQCRLARWNPDPKTMLCFDSNGSTPGIENFRALRSRLYRVRETSSLKTLAIVSSVPKEGRSFVAANLAQAMARHPGSRVLLLDADLRNPSLHSVLGTCQTPGLSEYLLGESGDLSVIQRGQIENLFFLAGGRAVSGQSDVISNGRFKTLLDRLSTLFDWIVIDSPAALPVSDAELIASFCDGVLMVVRSNSTPYDVVRKARRRFREEHILGVVLNGIPIEKHLEKHYNHDSSNNRNGKWE